MVIKNNSNSVNQTHSANANDYLVTLCRKLNQINHGIHVSKLAYTVKQCNHNYRQTLFSISNTQHRFF